MNRAIRAARAAVILAGVVGLSGAISTADGQVRRQPPLAVQPAPPPPRPQAQGPATRIGFAGELGQSAFSGQMIQPGFRHHVGQSFVPPVYYYPVPIYYYPSSCGASVCDVNGNRVMRSFDEPEPYHQQRSPATIPDLSGSPYVALDGGVILVDFGNGDRRTIPSCVAQQSTATPDGQPRTIFYAPPADGLILRAGERGNIMGTPIPGGRMCYGLDQYGRVALNY